VLFTTDACGLRGRCRALAFAICDAAMTAAVRDRQMSYLADSRPVTQETVLNWSWRTRLWNNALAVVGPVL
jgi:cardiolipin synthase